MTALSWLTDKRPDPSVCHPENSYHVPGCEHFATLTTAPAVPLLASGLTDPAGARQLPEIPLAPPVPGRADPGHCREHPALALISRKDAGDRQVWGDQAEMRIVCPDPRHDEYSRERCSYCGGALHPPVKTGYWRYASRRLTCSATCRNYLWRWLRTEPAKRKATVAP